MNVETGRIGTMDELLGEGSCMEDLVQIQREMATEQQLADGYVALNDKKTKLGKLRTIHDPLTKNQRKRMMRKLAGK